MACRRAARALLASQRWVPAQAPSRTAQHARRAMAHSAPPLVRSAPLGPTPSVPRKPPRGRHVYFARRGLRPHPPAPTTPRAAAFATQATAVKRANHVRPGGSHRAAMRPFPGLHASPAGHGQPRRVQAPSVGRNASQQSSVAPLAQASSMLRPGRAGFWSASATLSQSHPETSTRASS